MSGGGRSEARVCVRRPLLPAARAFRRVYLRARRWFMLFVARLAFSAYERCRPGIAQAPAAREREREKERDGDGE